MNSFIQRKFENIENNEIKDFNNIVKIHIKMPLGETDVEKQYQSNLAIILGEPASGKTYQLKEYNKSHKNTYFIELINFADNENITDGTEIVLIDSIDEALVDYNNPKKLQKKLTDFIKKCQIKNPKMRFAISCRFLEWSEYFESSLKEIDKELRVYKILPLSKEDIDNLLDAKNITKEEFWSFIDNNYLEPLLKNILVLLHIVDQFREYVKQPITFVDIYYDIAKKYLVKKGLDRTEKTIDITVEKLLKISSSLAAYMIFNRKPGIDVSNLSELAGELYQVDGSSIVASELKMVLDSALFDKKDNGLAFFHKSIQEYLTAYFLYERNLSSDQLKELLANDLRFYEEFEEVVVFLTNIDKNLFDNFVEFDPFIFKRHPFLTKKQQEKLLLSILNKYKVDFSQVWGRWESFEDSTLVRFDKLDNLVYLLKEYASLEYHGFYLMKLLQYNYTQELKKFIFNLFENNLSNQKYIEKVIRDNFIDNYDFNIFLYEFLHKHNLLKKDTHQLFMSFEAELFSSLYGIKYRFSSDTERITKRTPIEFQKIIPLLDFIPSNNLRYIAPYLLKEDAEKWLNYIKNNYLPDKYSYKFIKWVIFANLKYCDSKDTYKNIASILKENKIYLYDIDKKEMRLDFKNVAKIFWQIYFETNILQDFYSRNVTSFYDITLEDIRKATNKYPIKNYIEKYIYFRPFGNDINKFLMQDKDFEKYMHNEWEKQKKQQKELNKEIREKYPIRKEKQRNKEQHFSEAIDRFNTKKETHTDYLDIFRYVFNKQYDNATKIDESLKEKLSDKYPNYIAKIKQKFKEDNLYKEIKNNLLSRTIYYDTLIYNYLIEILDDGELSRFISTRKDYIKLFWHIYKKSLNSFNDKFIKLSENYFNCFILLSLHALQMSIKQSNGKDIGSFRFSILAFKELKKFDKKSIKPITNYLIENQNIILSLKELYDKEQLLEVVALDENNYLYILELMSLDETDMAIYLQYLLKINTNKALEDFYKIYDNKNRYKSGWERFKLRFTNKRNTGYDNQIINPGKIKLFQYLMKSLRVSQKVVNNKIEPPYIKKILSDYYEFFKEYKTPTGEYSINIYDDMYWVINSIWGNIENSCEYINILEELQKSKIKRLSNQAKYALTKAYEQQRKERNHPNSYYQSIFDMKDKKNKKSINIDIKGNQNAIAIGNNNTQVTGRLGNSKKDNWWLISLGIGVLVGGITWWQFGWIWGCSLCIVSSLIMLYLNPKRRYWVAAWFIFSIAGINGILHFIGTLKIPDNTYINGIIKFGQTNNTITLALMALSGFLFFLDHKERKQ